MTSKFTRVLLAMAFVISVAALAQTGSAASTAAAAPASAAPAVTGTGTKVGTISMEQAIFATNEGRRDFEALGKEARTEAERTEGPERRDRCPQEAAERAAGQAQRRRPCQFVKQIETKQKSLDRQLQDAREDAQNQQNEIAQRIIQKLGQCSSSTRRTTDSA